MSLPLFFALSHFAGVMEKVGEAVKKTAQAFSADGGSVGSQFKSDGAVGSTAEQGEFCRPRHVFG